MKKPMTVLVTGASSGLGLHTAQQLAAAGMTVIAGARSFAGDRQDGMHRLPLDVTDDASCEAFVENAKKISPRIDATSCRLKLLVLFFLPCFSIRIRPPYISDDRLPPPVPQQNTT